MSKTEKFLLAAIIHNAAWMIELDESLKIIPAILMSIFCLVFVLVDAKKDLTSQPG